MDVTTVRERLESIRADLDRSISVLDGTGEWRRVDDSPRDASDAGANLSESDRSEALLDHARRQRTDVLAALHRIEAGTYGTCTDCGGPVPDRRLEAKPEAARCVACQGRADRGRR